MMMREAHFMSQSRELELLLQLFCVLVLSKEARAQPNQSRTNPENRK